MSATRSTTTKSLHTATVLLRVARYIGDVRPGSATESAETLAIRALSLIAPKGWRDAGPNCPIAQGLIAQLARDGYRDETRVTYPDPTGRAVWRGSGATWLLAAHEPAGERAP